MTKAAELAKMGEVLTNSQIGGRRNIIINGAMQVAQRGTSETGIGASAGYFTLDRFRIQPTSTAGRLTMEQVADVHDGFANALKLTCTTADTSIAADERLLLHQKIEGQDLQQLKKGTSDAEEFTVSFYVKGNASATYVLEIYDLDNNRQISKTFSVTTSWNRVILNFPADTTGAYDDDNAASLQMSIFLHAGSNFTSGTLNSSAFAANTDANRAVGISSFFDSTDRTLEITGLQMEVGSQATPFEHRSFGEELALCQRYFQTLSGLAYVTLGVGVISNARDRSRAHVAYNTTMRASPSISIDGTLIITDRETYEQDISSIDGSSTGVSGAYVNFAHSAAGTSLYANIIASKSGTDSSLYLDSEL